MFALLGAELYAPQKAAICAALRATAPSPADAAAAAAKPELLTYPLKITDLGYGQDRKDQYTGFLIGDAGVMSTAIHAPISTVELITRAEPVAVIEAQVPPERGVFSRREVAELQRANQERMARAWASASAESLDAVSRLEAAQARMEEAGQWDVVAELTTARDVATRHSQAVAHTLRTAADRLQPGQSGVAIVNIGTMGPLARNWVHAEEPRTLFPPPALWQQVVGNGLPLGVASGFGYGYYRFFRRFPKTAGVCGVLLGLGAFTMIHTGVIYQEDATLGPMMRHMLANPSLSSAAPAKPGVRP